MFPNFDELKKQIEDRFNAIQLGVDRNAEMLESLLSMTQKIIDKQAEDPMKKFNEVFTPENINEAMDKIENVVMKRTLDLAEKHKEFTSEHPQFAPANLGNIGGDTEKCDAPEPVISAPTHSTPIVSGATHSQPIEG